MPGGGKGGKGGGTITVVGDANKPVTMDVTADVDMNTTIGGGERPVRMENLSVTTMGGGDKPLATDMTMHTPDVLRTEMRSVSEMAMRSVSEMAITRPIETTSDMRMDIQPVVVDLSVTANIGKIPRLCIKRPYEQHLRVRVFGVEVLGVDLHGEKATIVTDLPARPTVAWGGEGHRPRPHPQVNVVDVGGAHGHSHGPPTVDHGSTNEATHGQHWSAPHQEPFVVPAEGGAGSSGPGLRIRLGP